MPPSFLVIGAQKAGTTWLYERLRVHPEIWMPYQKELHYFDEKAATPHLTLKSRLRGRRPVDIRWRRQLRRAVKGRHIGPSPSELRWWADYFLRDTDDEWYLRRFAPAGRGVTGDITPGYALVDEATVEHARELVPDAKIIYFLRHPVERAWSNAVMQLQLGSRRGVGDNELRRHFESRGSTSRTAYLETLDRWSARFSPDRFFVGFFEDIVLRPVELLDEVCTFIGVAQLPVGEGAGDAVHQGRSSAIPARHARHLATVYLPQILELADRLGSYASWWQYSSEQLAALSDDAPDIPYPFVRTEMLRDWMAAEGLPGDAPPVGSSRLDLVRCSNSSD